MNPLDLFVLGVCAGGGTRDHHSGGFFFDSEVELARLLRQVGLVKWHQQYVIDRDRARRFAWMGR